MTSTAISSANTHVYISSAAGTAKVITGISKANPCVVTSAAHGFAVGAVVVFASIGGMTELNGRAAVVTAQTSGDFTLGGIDSTTYTTYTSGGTATPQTMVEVENVKNWNMPGNPAAELEVTNLASTAVERIAGLQDRGSVSIDLDIDTTGPGQAAIRNSVGVTQKAMKVVLQTGKAMAVMIAWNNIGHTLGVAATFNGQATGFVYTDESWYA